MLKPGDYQLIVIGRDMHGALNSQSYTCMGLWQLLHSTSCIATQVDIDIVSLHVTCMIYRMLNTALNYIHLYIYSYIYMNIIAQTTSQQKV